MKFAPLAIALLAWAGPALAQDGPPPPGEVIAQFDTNGDKALDRTEWAASPAPLPYPEEADANKDGKLDLPELTALFARFQSGELQLPPPPPPPP